MVFYKWQLSLVLSEKLRYRYLFNFNILPVNAWHNHLFIKQLHSNLYIQVIHELFISFNCGCGLIILSFVSIPYFSLSFDEVLGNGPVFPRGRIPVLALVRHVSPIDISNAFKLNFVDGKFGLVRSPYTVRWVILREDTYQSEVALVNSCFNLEICHRCRDTVIESTAVASWVKGIHFD